MNGMQGRDVQGSSFIICCLRLCCGYLCIPCQDVPTHGEIDSRREGILPSWDVRVVLLIFSRYRRRYLQQKWFVRHVCASCVKGRPSYHVSKASARTIPLRVSSQSLNGLVNQLP